MPAGAGPPACAGIGAGGIGFDVAEFLTERRAKREASREPLSRGEKPPRALDLEGEQCLEARIPLPSRDRPGGPGMRAHLVGGEIRPSVRQVDREILTEVRELQAGADVVGQRDGDRIAHAEQAEDESSDRVGRIGAIGRQRREVRERLERRVEPERAQQRAERVRTERMTLDGVRDRPKDRPGLVPGERRIQLGLPRVEGRVTVAGESRLVRDVVRATRERIQRREMAALRPRQQAGADREVLVVRLRDRLAVRVRPVEVGAHEAASASCWNRPSAMRGKKFRYPS